MMGSQIITELLALHKEADKDGAHREARALSWLVRLARNVERHEREIERVDELARNPMMALRLKARSQNEVVTMQAEEGLNCEPGDLLEINPETGKVRRYRG